MDGVVADAAMVVYRTQLVNRWSFASKALGSAGFMATSTDHEAGSVGGVIMAGATYSVRKLFTGLAMAAFIA